MIAGVALIAVIAVVVIGINLSSDTAANLGSATGASKKTIKTFGDADFPKILIDPKGNRGAKVNISGEVQSLKKKGKIWRMELLQDPENDDGLTIVESKSDENVKKGDSVRVAGTVKGEEILKDSDGGKIKVPVIEASSLSNISNPPANSPSDGPIHQGQGMM